MRRCLRVMTMVLTVVLTVGFLASSLSAESRRHPAPRQGTQVGARRSDDHARQPVYVTRPYAGVNPRYTTRHRDSYEYRRPTYGNDGAFRVLPYSYYYGYSIPQVVVPHSYYYYYDYDTPQVRITFTWSW